MGGGNSKAKGGKKDPSPAPTDPTPSSPNTAPQRQVSAAPHSKSRTEAAGPAKAATPKTVPAPHGPASAGSGGGLSKDGLEDGGTAAIASFFEAFKALPADGWVRMKGGQGQTVSVYRNESSKLPFKTTLVKSEFECKAAASEAKALLLNLTERSQRDYFYRDGKLDNMVTETHKVIKANMRTLSGTGVEAVQVHQLLHTDDKGNFSIVEVPSDRSKGGAACFFFPSFWIQNLGPSSCKVVAHYRFDFERACPKKADFSDGEAGSFLQERFNSYADPLASSLLLLGGGAAMPEAPKRRPAEQATPEPKQPPPPAVSMSPARPREEGVGELIVGTKFKWKKGELIGHGSIGKVYMGLDFETGEMMAVKQVDLGQQLGAQAAEEIKAMEQEIAIFSKISHPNIVRYYGVDRDQDRLSIFLEFVSGGSIASMLRKFGSFSEQMIANFTAQIVDGLDYLHQQQICHRDIKAANILYSNDGIVKLADFGTAKKIADVMNMSTGLKSLVGTPYMMAPEVIRQTGHGMPADIWSLACVIWEMATCKPPFTQFTDRIVAMYNIAHATKPPDPPEMLTAAARDFVKKCMLIDAKHRATTQMLLQHNFVATVVRKTVGTPVAANSPQQHAYRFPDPAQGHSVDSVDRAEFGAAPIAEESDEETAASPAAGVPRGKSGGRRPAAASDDDDESPERGVAATPKKVANPAAPSRGGGSRERGEEGGGGGERKASHRGGGHQHHHKHRGRGGGEGEGAAAGGGRVVRGTPGDPKYASGGGVAKSNDYDLTSSDEGSEDEEEDESYRQQPGGGGKGGRRGSAGGKDQYQGELSIDGYTKAQCEALGKEFKPAGGGGKPKGGVRPKWMSGRDEVTDSENDSEEEEDRRRGAKKPLFKGVSKRPSQAFSDDDLDSD